jgi:hypothetical protein
MDRRIAAGVGLFLAMEVLNTYQLVLPPLYGTDTFDSKEVRQAAKFVGAYILIIAFLAGAITSSPLPMLLPAVAILLVYYFYMYETGKKLEATVPGEEEE